MKILMVNKFLYPRGGSESYMLKLGNELEQKGHTVEYFGMYDEQNTVGNSLGVYTQNMDFHTKAVSRFLYPFKIIFSLEAMKKIGKVLDDFKPDVVHMNNINFQLTPSIIYAVKKRKIPLVQTVHDYQMICPNHLMYSFTKSKPCTLCLNGNKLNCLKHSCIHNSKIKSLLGVIEAYFYSLLKTYRLVDLYICPSFFLENKLLTASKIFKEKTFTLHNFVDTPENFKPVNEPKDYIAFVGRLSKEKGVELLAKTAQLLPHRNFVVAGSGPEENLLLNIQNIKLMGFLNGDALTDMMSNAKLLLLPSICFENCPLSILEAHSFGVPVVTMNSGGMVELTNDGENGTLTFEPTPKDLATAIEKNFDDAYYNMVKDNCKKQASSILRVDRYCDIVLEKYTDIIRRS